MRQAIESFAFHTCRAYLLIEYAAIDQSKFDEVVRSMYRAAATLTLSDLIERSKIFTHLSREYLADGKVKEMGLCIKFATILYH
ncbi:hypothetical protein [Chromobacterium haemolyticum]|uniref:hypothetical protein n=1 Tax=Chromobacterium haemolyticum TaxID=394935 RepID=UPI0011773F95|nr:hypothetical protein [Chromobacterium haemolyticum]